MYKLKSLFVVMLLASLLSACGGGGGSDSAPDINATAASIGIIFTDSSAVDAALAAAIPADVMAAAAPGAQLLITVTSVELKGNDGDQSIFSALDADPPEPVIIDLYELKDSLELFFVNESVVPGTFNKIRLYISNVVRCESALPASESASESAFEEADCDDVKLPSNKIDFNPRESFTLAAGDVVIVTLDIHANKSLKLSENPRKLILRPVVFVDIDSEPAFKEGLVRVSGLVGGTSTDSFLLCSVAFVTPLGMASAQTQLNEMCIAVLITPRTGVFGPDGKPIDDIGKLAKGDPVTVVGLLQLGGDQPEITPLAEGDPMPTPFQIVAVVVEGGLPALWDRYQGRLVSAPEFDQEVPVSWVFKFLLASDEPVVEEPVVPAADEGDEPPADEGTEPEVDDAALTARIYEKTRIFAIDVAEGLIEIMPGDLNINDRAIVEAVMPPKPVTPDAEVDALEDEVPADDPVVDNLRIALMLVLRGDDTPGPELLRGKISSVIPVEETGSAGGLWVISDETGDPVCVESADTTLIYLLVGKEDSVQVIDVPLSALEPGSRIAIAGDSGAAGDCFAAALMIAGGAINP